MRKLLLLCVAVFMTIMSWAQRTVTGRVTDDKGSPLPNVSVLIKGTNRGTVTGTDGSFSVNVPAEAHTLVFSAVDMALKEVSIGNQSTVSVTLEAANRSLEEVVVVGYGTQKRKEMTSNVATVKGGDVAQKPVQSFEQALGGRAAGVQITVPSGVLNAPPVFRIRGTNSLSLSSYPLVVVDGVPSFTGDYSSTNAGGNALANINPNDIESIDIAKDAAATAIYGSRAANGVVFITTKKGKAGKPRVSYNGSVGWAKAIRLPDMMDAFQYTDYKNLAASNNAGVNSTDPTKTGYTKFALTNDANGKPINTNWFDYVYRTGFSQNHNVNISGGNDATTYYFGAGYTDQEGIVKKNDFKRISTLFNLDSRLNRVVTIGGKISYSNERNLAATTSGSRDGEAFSTAGLGRTAVVTAPSVAPYNNDGSYNIGATYIGSMGNSVQSGFFNPVVLLDKNRSNSENNRIQSNAYLQLKPLKWMTLRTLYGVDYLLVDNDLFWTPLHGDGKTYGGYGANNFGKYKKWLWTNTAQFDYTVANDHNLSLLLGNEQEKNTSSGYGINRQTLSDPQFDVIQAGYGTNYDYGMTLGENYLLSNFGRLNYDFAKKYFLSGNIRRDEYSALGVKAGTFWGVSAGWEISKENFWTNAQLNNVFTSFKLRGSYGTAGNIGGMPNYPTYSTYGSGLYGGDPTLAFNQAGNPDITWEKSSKTDVGFSFGMFRDRLTADFAYYKNDISDLILYVPQSPSTGLPNSIPMNVGTMYNKGIEVTLSGTPVQTADFTWNTSFNLSTNKNEVTSLAPGLKEVLQSTSGLETVNKTMVGYPAGTLWVVRTGGVDPASGRRIFINSQGKPVLFQYYAPSGQFQYSNPDGSKYVSPTGGSAINQAADAVMYANTAPKQYGGWDNTFRYKGFDLNVLTTFMRGFSVYYGSNAGLHDQRFWNNATDILDHWNKPGDVAKFPKPVYGDNVSNGSAMPLDINVFKGDFVKLKSVRLGYTLPQSVIGRAKLTTANVYVAAQNLAILTDYPGPDPEVSSNGNSTLGQGVDRNTVGNARTITVGLNIGF